jgi:peptidoglycan hydrolase FlgJ
MQIPALQTSGTTKAADVPFEKLAANKSVSEQDKVTEACKQFEAVLLRQILQEARKTVISSSANPESSTSGIYGDMVNNQLADKISRSGEFGLAKSLQAQLVRQVLPDSNDAIAQGKPALKNLDSTKNFKPLIHD